MNPTAIICDLQELEPAVFDDNFKRRGSGIDGVLNQLFEGVHGRDDDLARCNLVDDIWVESLQGVRMCIYDSQTGLALILRVGRASSGGESAFRLVPLGPSTSMTSDIAAGVLHWDWKM